MPWACCRRDDRFVQPALGLGARRTVLPSAQPPQPGLARCHVCSTYRAQAAFPSLSPERASSPATLRPPRLSRAPPVYRRDRFSFGSLARGHPLRLITALPVVCISWRGSHDPLGHPPSQSEISTVQPPPSRSQQFGTALCPSADTSARDTSAGQRAAARVVFVIFPVVYTDSISPPRVGPSLAH